MEHCLKVPVRYHFQWRKATVGWLQRVNSRKWFRVRLKSIALLQHCKIKQKNIVVLKYKNKTFFLRKLTETPNLIICSSEISKIFICFRVSLAFLSENWTKIILLKKCPLYGFRCSSISQWRFKCVKGKQIENKRDQTRLSFSTRSPR